MSQFILAQGVTPALLPRSIEWIPAQTDEFLEAAGEHIFGLESAEQVGTLEIDGEDFDTVFSRAQREMADGSPYSGTRLNALLVSLSKTAKRFALWYGSDYANLEIVRDLPSLNQTVQDGLSSPSVEAYAMFVRPQSMAQPLLYADFNEMLEPDLVLLSTTDSKPDVGGNPVLLFDGLEVCLYMDDADASGRPDKLLASGVVERNRSTGWGAHVKWCCRIDSRGIKHRSEL